MCAEAIWYAMGTKFSPGINQWDSHLLNTRTEIGLKGILDRIGISDGGGKCEGHMDVKQHRSGKQQEGSKETGV